MRNLICLLPGYCIPIEYWAPHPCGGYYMEAKYCFGPQGFIGYYLDERKTEQSKPKA